MQASEIIRRYEFLKGERTTVQDLWELIHRFVLPFKGDFYRDLETENELEWRVREIYDSTAVYACQSLAASMQGNLTSPSTLWFDLKYRDEKLNDNPEAKEWLEDTAKRIFEALQDSNFNIEAAETYIDLVGYGTSILVEEAEDDLEWKGVNFQSVPIRECFFEEDSKKQVKTLYRELSWTPVQILDKFGKDTPQIVKDRASNPESANTREIVVFCIYERKDKKDADTSKPLAPDARPFGYKYILKNGTLELGDEGGYYEMAAFVARWRKASGSRWGHGPAATAMGDILSLNQLKETILQSAAKVIDPAILVEEGGVFSDLELGRGSLNVVADIDRIKPFESGARFDVGGMEVGMLQDSIKQGFYQDQLALKESPAMTATEASIRYELMQRLLGPTLGRLQNDFLDPLVQRTFNIMLRAGALKEQPKGISIGEMDIDYTGPLPRAQKADTAQAIERWIGGIANIAEIFPEALDRVDMDSAAKEIAVLTGVPSKLIKNDDEVEEIRRKRKEAQEKAQKAAQAAQLGEAGEAIGKGAQAMKEGGVNVEEAAKQLG